MSEPEKPLYDSSKMEYRYLGDSGLRVSVLSFGVMMHDNVENLKEILKICLNNGVNFFDTAEVYGMGVAEKTFGQAIKELNVPREKIIVSIKILRSGSDPNDSGEGRKHIIEGVKQSLKNLQLDYCDIVFAHRYDRDTPIEETVRAMNYLIEKGLTFYWATSEWTPDQIERAFNIAKDRNLIPPICDQAHYNLVYREIVDSQYRDLFRFRKYGITAWSPLEGGILTGKYMDNKIPEGSRISSGRGRLPATWEKNKADWEPKFVKLQKLAKEKLDCTLTQLSIAWCIKNTDVSTAILGAMNPDQIKEDLKALEVSKKLTKEILEEIETIMKNAPKGEVAYFKGFGPMPIRRNIQEGINKTEF
jgi:voltage-dependent potassium channel beta subunit